MEAVSKSGRVCKAAICYTVGILDPKRDKHTLAINLKGHLSDQPPS